MSGTLRLKGSTSGYSELQAPAVAGDQTFILPAVGGDLLTTDNPAPYLTLESGVVTAPSLRFEGDSNTGIYSPGANQIAFTASGVEQARLTTSGTNSPRLGIGNTDPDAILTLGSFTGPDQLIRMRASSGQVMGLDMGDTSDPDAGRVRYYLSNSYLGFFTESAQRIRIDSDGLKFGTDSAAANALDDYEEGTWTPTITDCTAYAAQVGSYVKIGRYVYWQCRVQPTAATPSSSPMQLIGLPYPSSSHTSGYGAAIDSYGTLISRNGIPDLKFHHPAGGSLIRFLSSTYPIATHNTNVTLIGNFLFSGWYLVNS